MRVLQIMASGARGGGADHLLGLLPALQDLGIRCQAAVGDDGPLGEALAPHMPVARFPMMDARLNGRAMGTLVQTVRAMQPDIVHCHGTRAAFFMAGARLALGRHVRFVYTAHGLSYRKETTLRRRLLFMAAELAACRRAHEVISVSLADLDDLRRRRLLAATRGVHIPNAVDVARFGHGSRDLARQRLGLPQEAFVVGTTSRLVPQKAVGDLLDSVANCPNVTVVVIGEGPERAQLRHHPVVQEGRAKLVGGRDDVPALLPAFDVFALASRWEGEPIALLEAMASGLPCVATATAGAVEILRGSGAGLLVDVGQVPQLAAAIRVLQRDDDSRARMAQAGRMAVANRTHDHQARRVLTVYEGLLSDAKSQTMVATRWVHLPGQLTSEANMSQVHNNTASPKPVSHEEILQAQHRAHHEANKTEKAHAEGTQGHGHKGEHHHAGGSSKAADAPANTTNAPTSPFGES